VGGDFFQVLLDSADGSILIVDVSEHFPIASKPSFAANGLRILLPVQLEPHQSYSFVRPSNAFATPDGFPLASYTVDFRTKWPLLSSERNPDTLIEPVVHGQDCHCRRHFRTRERLCAIS
jgi:hypothetical protein